MRRVVSEMSYVTEGAHRIRDEGGAAQVWDTGLEVWAVTNVGLSPSDDIRTIESNTCARVISARRDVEGETGRSTDEWRDLPAGEQDGTHATTVPRDGGNDDAVADMAHVSRARTIVTLESVGVLDDALRSQRCERSDTETFGPGVVHKDRVVVGKAGLEGGEQSVVVRVRTIVRDHLG